MKTKFILLLTICFLIISANAQKEAVKIPAEIEPFVENGTIPIALESADLNGDSLPDYILVIERPDFTAAKYGFDVQQRPLLILIRGKDNKLSEAKRNEQIVFCADCGGMMGDPFMGVTVGKNTFTVNHYGGSAWRWELSYKFNYSKVDKTWQLVRFERSDFHATDSKTLKTQVKFPKDFGKVDIAEFVPVLFDEDSDKEQTLTEDEIKDLLPEGFRTIHKVVSGDFGDWNSGGQNKPEFDSRKKFVLLYANETPANTYKIKVVIPAGFEAFDTHDLPSPEYTCSIMEPLAGFFENVDKDSEKELLILEQCMTGVGPTGAKYFYRTRVYDWNGKDFVHLDKISEKIGNLDTAAKVRKRLIGLKK